MDVFTTQLAQWRTVVGLGVEVVNITAKSGLQIFAPTIELVNASKYRGMEPTEYRQHYLQLMNWSYRNERVRWEEFLMYHQNNRIALACYCGAGEFCHRHLLVPLLGKVAAHYNIPFQYHGEIV